MNFIYLEKDIFFMRPINIHLDIDAVIKCTMFKSYVKPEDQKPLPGYQFVAIKIRPSVVKVNKRHRSHIIFVQHQNSAEGSNLSKMVDFINYHRMENSLKVDKY